MKCVSCLVSSCFGGIKGPQLKAYKAELCNFESRRAIWRVSLKLYTTDPNHIVTRFLSQTVHMLSIHMTVVILHSLVIE